MGGLTSTHNNWAYVTHITHKIENNQPNNQPMRGSPKYSGKALFFLEHFVRCFHEKKLHFYFGFPGKSHAMVTLVANSANHGMEIVGASWGRPFVGIRSVYTQI